MTLSSASPAAIWADILYPRFNLEDSLGQAKQVVEKIILIPVFLRPMSCQHDSAGDIANFKPE